MRSIATTFRRFAPVPALLVLFGCGSSQSAGVTNPQGPAVFSHGEMDGGRSL